MRRGDREAVLRFVRERNVFESSDGQRRTIIGTAVDPESGNEITIKGDADDGELRAGLTYRFFGQVVVHHKYGEQWVFSGFAVEQPTDGAGIEAYLIQCGGISKGTARAIVQSYDDDTLRMLREEPEFVVANLAAKYRLTAEKLTTAVELLDSGRRTERTKIELISLLRGRGFPRKLADEAIREWGPLAPEIVKRHPFSLMRFAGCGFLNTDRFYCDLGLPPGRLRRQLHCLEHGLVTDGSGSTWAPLKGCDRHVRSKIAGSQVDTARAIELGVRSGRLAVADYAGSVWVGESRQVQWEHTVAEIAVEAHKADVARRELKGGIGVTLWPDPADLDKLSEHQREQLIEATLGTIGILRGSPGTGKTYVAACLIRSLIATYGAGAVAIAAPTGKAAVRLTESLSALGVDLTASTIHRLLGVETADGGGFTFVHGAGNPLPFKFLIIDESSMIDTTLMGQLLSACAAGTHVLFVGDPYQLPPVGHGKPFLDLSAYVPFGELTEIRRNSGRIVQACAAIRDRQEWQPSPHLDVEAGENLVLEQKATPAAQIETLEMHLARYAKASNVDAVWDVQVLVAVNKKSEIARGPLNKRLQSLLNPEGHTLAGHPYRVGDKVVCTKNGWYQEICGTDRDAADLITANDRGEMLVANGELGKVLSIEPTRTVVEMQSPRRTILVPHKPVKAARNDDEPPDGPPDDDAAPSGGIGNWDLGYALSCHKSQGSEWPIVLVMLDGSGAGQRVTSRNWLYTAISRAKEVCRVIGKSSDAISACRRDGLAGRQTLLPALLAGEPVTYLRGDALRERVKIKPKPKLSPIVADVPVERDAADDNDPPAVELTTEERLSLFAPRVAAGV